MVPLDPAHGALSSSTNMESIRKCSNLDGHCSAWVAYWRAMQEGTDVIHGAESCWFLSQSQSWQSSDQSTTCILTPLLTHGIPTWGDPLAHLYIVTISSSTHTADIIALWLFSNPDCTAQTFGVMSPILLSSWKYCNKPSRKPQHQHNDRFGPTWCFSVAVYIVCYPPQVLLRWCSWEFL